MPDELKAYHRKLRPEKAIYSAWVDTPAQGQEPLDWFVRNT